MHTGLQDLVVLVTGASGGIGSALGWAFAAEGSRLVLHAGSRLEALEPFMQAEVLADRVQCVSADVRDPDAVDRMLRVATEQFGRVDACIVNAGIWPSEVQPLHAMEPERIRDVIETNVLGAMWTARSFMQYLAQAGPRPDGRGASLCFIGSTAGRFGEAGHGEYATSKAALLGLMRSLKNEIVELDPYGRVNMVEPGWTVTPITRSTLDDADSVRRLLATMPVRQLARPEDIARSVLYLTSPHLARHVSGEVITVAGGMEGRVQWSAPDVDVEAVKARLAPDEPR